MRRFDLTVTHVTPYGFMQVKVRQRLSLREVVARVILAGFAAALAVLAIVSVAGFASTSGSPVAAAHTAEVKLCDALRIALPTSMKLSTNYDAKSKEASCTGIDAHYNAASLYMFVPTSSSANEAAYNESVKKDVDIAKPGYGCSADNGQLDTSSQNNIPGTMTAYGCNLVVGAIDLGTRVDALTTGNRYVSFSITYDPAVLRSQSTLMVAQSAFAQLAMAS